MVDLDARTPSCPSSYSAIQHPGLNLTPCLASQLSIPRRVEADLSKSRQACACAIGGKVEMYLTGFEVSGAEMVASAGFAFSLPYLGHRFLRVVKSGRGILFPGISPRVGSIRPRVLSPPLIAHLSGSYFPSATRLGPSDPGLERPEYADNCNQTVNASLV